MTVYRDDQNEPRRRDEHIRSVSLPEGLLRRLKEVATKTDADLDEAVRRIQEPQRMIARLKAIPLAENPELIDEAAATVPVPEGLTDRLRMVPLCDDQGMDMVLREVPVPPAVSETADRVLRAEEGDVPAATPPLPPPVPLRAQEYARAVLAEGDAGIDRYLCEVPLPESLATRLMAIPLESETGDRSSADVAAAAFMEPQSGAYSPTGAHTPTSPPLPPEPSTQSETSPSTDMVQVAPKGTVLTEWADKQAHRRRRARFAGTISTVSVAALLAFVYYGGYAERLVTYLMDDDQAPTERMIVEDPVFERMPSDPPSPILVTPTPEEMIADGSPVQPVEAPTDVVSPDSPFDSPDPTAVAVTPAPVVSSIPTIDPETMPGMYKPGTSRTEPQEIPRLWPVGVEPPLAPGFDMAFLARSGIHPAIRLTEGTRLDSSTFPLLADTTDYELFRRTVEEGERPNSDDIRPESFLAALDCGLPAPTDSKPLSLTTAMGPSPINPKAVLMQVGVSARDLIDVPRDPVSLVLAVDVSESMGRHARLAKVRRALIQWIEQGGLRPLDQVTVVAFSDRATVAAERLSGYGSSQLRDVFDSLEIGGVTYLETGLTAALDTAAAQAKYFSARAEEGFGFDRLTHRVILVTDGTDVYDPQVLEVLQQRVAQASGDADAPVKLDIIDVGGRPTLEEGENTDPTDPLVMLAESSGGRVLRASLVPRISAALQQIITGRDQRVADGVEVRVELNPKTVLAYRLIGHEGGALTFDSRTDFQAGQWAQGIYVLQLRDKVKSSDVIATVDLSWSPVSGSASQGIRRSIRKSDIAQSMVESPLSFQQASLVYGATEILRESPFVKQVAPRPMLQVILDKARHVDTRLFQRKSFSELMELVEKAAAVTSSRRGR